MVQSALFGAQVSPQDVKEVIVGINPANLKKSLRSPAGRPHQKNSHFAKLPNKK